MNFNWLVHYVECPNVLTTNCNLQKGYFVYNHLKFNQFIAHCPIHLDPCYILKNKMTAASVNDDLIRTCCSCSGPKTCILSATI